MPTVTNGFHPIIRAGDVIGFSGDCWLSAFINLATYGIPYWSISHVGVMADYADQLLLFESTVLSDIPCAIQGIDIPGTKAVALEERVKGYCGKIWHYPLYRLLYDFERERLSEFLLSTLGMPYDSIGAVRAGGLGWSWLESKLWPADLSAIFCSEWVCAAHTVLGVFQTDHISRWSPNRLIRTERKRGILQAPWRLK
jgi:hypothetical protein